MIFIKTFYDIFINVDSYFPNESAKEPVSGLLTLAKILAEDHLEAKNIFIKQNPGFKEKHGIDESMLMVNRSYDDKPISFLKDLILEISDLSYSEIDTIYDIYERFPNYYLENAIEQSMDNLLSKYILYSDFTSYCADLVIKKLMHDKVIDFQEENKLYSVLSSVEPYVTGIGYNSISYYDENFPSTSELFFEFCSLGTHKELDDYVDKIYEEFQKEKGAKHE